MALYKTDHNKWEDVHNAWESESFLWSPTNAYENIVFDRILGKLHALLTNEFFIPVYFDQHRGNQSFLIQLLEDNIGQTFHLGQDREYIILIEHKLLSGGMFSRKKIKQISETYERVKRLLHNNVNYNEGWHYGRVESISTSRDDESLISAIQFNCVSTEMSPN